MPLPITSIYAALLALIYIVLYANVGHVRSKSGPAIGPGDAALLVADRRHMNFVESVPLALLLIALVEVSGVPRWWVDALGVVLLVARIIHPFGISKDQMNTLPRAIGAGGTLLVILAAAITLLWRSVF